MRSLIRWFCSVWILVLLVSCGGGEPPEIPVEDSKDTPLPEMAAVAGAQDLWPFSFGLDANRAVVESALGAPEQVNEKDVGQPDVTVFEWYYPGTELVFFRHDTEDSEYLLSARFSDGEAELGAGLRVGMPLDEALQILGNPGYERDQSIVIFYYTTTIELVTDGEVVTEISLARAMP